MSNENTNQTDTQTTAVETPSYPCACDTIGCYCTGFTSPEPDTICQDCAHGNHEYEEKDKGNITL